MRNLLAAPWTERHGSVEIEQSNTNNSAQGCGFLRMVGREKRAHQERSPTRRAVYRLEYAPVFSKTAGCGPVVSDSRDLAGWLNGEKFRQVRTCVRACPDGARGRNQFPPANPICRQASNTTTAMLLERLRLRLSGRIGSRRRCSGGRLSSTSTGRPRVSGPNSNASPER